MKRAYYDAKPKALEAVGNGNYLYRWDIKEEEVQSDFMQEGSDEPLVSEKRVQYSCCEATILGNPTYDKCVEAVIRDRYTAEQEMALVNKFNSYMNSVSTDGTGVDEYNEYLKYISDAKLMVKRDLELEEKLSLARQKKLNDIAAYDKSDNVNSFTLNGHSYWLDRETRMSVSFSTTQEKTAGSENTTVWLGNEPITLPCDTVLQLLAQLEIYAKKCYNKTAEHKSKVMELQSVKEVEEYDYTLGYPEKPDFEL